MASLQKFFHDYAIHLVFFALFAWLLRPKKSILGEELSSDSISLKSHTGMRILAGVVGLLGVFFLLISSALYMNPDGVEWGTALPCTIFSLGILYWVYKVFTFRIEADSHGLRYSAAMKKVVAEWKGLESIAWKERRSCHVLVTNRGAFPIASNIEGVALLFKMIAKHRPDLVQIGPTGSITPRPPVAL